MTPSCKKNCIDSFLIFGIFCKLFFLNSISHNKYSDRNHKPSKLFMRRQNKSSAEINWHTDLDIITISDTFISSCRNKYPDRNLKPSETFCRNKNKSSAESHQHTDRKAITVNIFLAISDTLFLSCRNSFSVINIKS